MDEDPELVSMIVHDPGQDRLIDEVYVWIAVDPATHLEGICGIMVGSMQMQAVSSSLEIAMKIAPLVKATVLRAGKQAYLARFTKKEIVSEI